MTGGRVAHDARREISDAEGGRRHEAALAAGGRAVRREALDPGVTGLLCGEGTSPLRSLRLPLNACFRVFRDV